MWAILSQWPSNAIWQYRSGSTLAQVTVCCLDGTKPLQNQCWLIIWWGINIYLRAISQEMSEISILDMSLKITSLRLQLHSSARDQWATITHGGRVTHICISKLTIIGSDNGLSSGWCQAIIWTNAGILLIQPLGTNFSEILIEIHTFSFKEMHLKMSSGKWRPFCPGCLNVLSP